MDKQFLLVADVAKDLGVSVRVVQHWCKEGRLPATRPDYARSPWLINPEDYEVFKAAYQQKKK